MHRKNRLTLDSMEALYGSPIPDYRVKVEPNHLFFIGDDK
jgi:hypothetical protein